MAKIQGGSPIVTHYEAVVLLLEELIFVDKKVWIT